MNLQQIAMNMIQSNPNIAANPQAQDYLNVIKSGDNQRGEVIARNLCQSMGVKPEDAYQQARRFFHL
jgi:hypothetical protein